MNKYILLLALVLPGCGSSSKENEPTNVTGQNECITDGSYMGVYTELSGTCGAIPDTLLNYDSPSSANQFNSSCYGGDIQWSTGDYCTGRLSNIKCDVGGGSFTMNGKHDWDLDGSYGLGIVTLSIALDNGQYCSSSYRLEMLRL